MTMVGSNGVMGMEELQTSGEKTHILNCFQLAITLFSCTSCRNHVKEGLKGL